MELPKRKPTRLKNFNYSTPLRYFITICAQDKKCIFSRIDNEKITLTHSGKIIDKYINEINIKFSHVKVNKYVIMPNHIHLILFVYGDEDTDKCKNNRYRDNVIEAVAWFKFMSTKDINNILSGRFEKIFQRSFHDHIIRGDKDYKNIWNYISSNPLLWHKDCFHPDNILSHRRGGVIPPET